MVGIRDMDIVTTMNIQPQSRSQKAMAAMKTAIATIIGLDEKGSTGFAAGTLVHAIYNEDTHTDSPRRSRMRLLALAHSSRMFFSLSVHVPNQWMLGPFPG